MRSCPACGQAGEPHDGGHGASVMMGDVDRATESGAVPAHGGGLRVPGDVPGGATPLGRSTVAVVLVAVAVAATALAGPWDPPLQQRFDVAEPSPIPVATLPAPSPDPLWSDVRRATAGDTWDLRWVGLVLLALLLALVGYVVLRVLRRLAAARRGEGAPDAGDLLAGGVVGGPGAMPDLPALREGVEDAEEHLRSRLSPQDAVIAAWVALEGAAASSGVRRDPAATPTEFTVAVLDRTPADPAATRTLLTLYLQARFGDDPLTAVDVEAATRAVRLLAEGVAHREDEPQADEHGDGEPPAADERPDGEPPPPRAPGPGGGGVP